MNKDLLVQTLADVPDDELVFIVRGSNPAAPETLREFARRTLHYQKLRQYSLDEAGAEQAKKEAGEARVTADEAFAMADRMERGETHNARKADEMRAGLTANGDNARLEAEAEADKERRHLEKLAQRREELAEVERLTVQIAEKRLKLSEATKEADGAT